MEGRKQVGGSSSFTSELFGSKDSYNSSSPSSSKGIFGSIFAHPSSSSSKVLGRESLRSEKIEHRKQDVNDEVWKNKPFVPDNSTRGSKGDSYSLPNKETSFVYQEERVQQPCHLSSSIFYGGQDNYSRPQSSQSPESQTNFRNDGGEDDSGIASRGNWWQGSLYY